MRRGGTTAIKIGYCLSLSGPLADNSRSARLAHEIWCEVTNRRGGLLGRPVEMICLDDRAEAVRVPDLYRQLMDDQKVDLVLGGYGTNTLLPALPLMRERGRYFVGLMGLGVNAELAYPNYFAMIPTGPNPNAALTEGFFEVASRQSPRPTTVAFLSADAEFSRNPILGARDNARKYGFQVVQEAVYPLSTQDFGPLLDQVAASQADVLLLCSYLQDTVGLVRSIYNHPYRPKMVGGAMIGPQNTSVRQELGPLLNGLVNYEYWVPISEMMSPEAEHLLRSYRERAGDHAVDPMGHYMAPLAYAQMQVVAQAIESTRNLVDARLSEYTRSQTFKTVMGQVRFGALGEWEQPRVLQVQFQNISGSHPEQFQDASRLAVLSPEGLASGKLIYPFRPSVPT